MENKKTESVGPWTLLEKLGEGGNATVWKAVRDSEPRPVAVKILKTKRIDREPYRRFVREIEVLKSIDDQRGILRLIDYYLPEAGRERPWLAMPIAKPIADFLSGADLESVVEAFAEIAETLSRLKESHGIAHRDIKPANLYSLRRKCLVGDFGLVAIPNLEELTKTGKPLGPSHFTAYEMIRAAQSADPYPADVYSLGKTLWVLATGQNFPPEGHQPARTRGYSIADLRPHSRASELDQLVDLCTRLHPQERPTMEQVNADLRGWLVLVKHQPVTLDVSDLRTRMNAKLERELREEDVRDQRKELAHAAVRHLQELMQPLNDSLRNAHPRPEIDVMDDRLVQNLLKTQVYGGAPDVIFRWQRTSRISSGLSHRRYMLKIGRSLELTDAGDLIFMALVDVGIDTLGGSDYNWMSGASRAPVGSIEAARMMEEGIAEVATHMREGLEIFVDHLPETAS